MWVCVCVCVRVYKKERDQKLVDGGSPQNIGTWNSATPVVLAD